MVVQCLASVAVVGYCGGMTLERQSGLYIIRISDIKAAPWDDINSRF